MRSALPSHRQLARGPPGQLQNNTEPWREGDWEAASAVFPLIVKGSQAWEAVAQMAEVPSALIIFGDPAWSVFLFWSYLRS